MKHEIIVYVHHCVICRPCWSPETGSTWWRGVTRALSRWDHHQVSQQTLTEQMFILGLENFQPRAPLCVPLVWFWNKKSGSVAWPKVRKNIDWESSSFKTFLFQIPYGRTCYWVRCSIPHRLQQMASRISATILSEDIVSIMFEPSMKVVKRVKAFNNMYSNTFHIILSMDSNDYSIFCFFSRTTVYSYVSKGTKWKKAKSV